MSCIKKIPPDDAEYQTQYLQMSLHKSMRIGLNPDQRDLIILLEPKDGLPPPAVCLTEKQCMNLILCLQTCLRDLSQMEPIIGSD
jgi:hypothetical protein